MDLRLRHYFGFAVLLLAVFCAGYGAGGDARAQETINIFPANADSAAVTKVRNGPDGSATATGDNVSCGLTGAGNSPLACTVQELINEAGPGDTVIFNPAGSGENRNVYDDVGEVLITTDGDDGSTDNSVETITIRGMGSGDDMITFTGKIMFNVKASNIVIRNFKFMNTEVPGSVTVIADNDGDGIYRETGDQVVYGFPGVTILDNLKDDASFSVADTVTSLTSTVAVNLAGNRPVYNNELWVSTVENRKRIANRHFGDALSIETTISPERNGLQVDRNSNIAGIMSSRAMNLLGTVWVDSSSKAACSAPGGGERTNVVIRNNIFQNTYLAGVKAGDHGSSPALSLSAGADANSAQAPGPLTGIVASEWHHPDDANLPTRTFGCSVQIEVVGNTFTGIGANGPFVKNSSGTDYVTGGNKVADLGNMEPAIELSRAGKSGTGSNEVTSKISHNTIFGGTSDGIFVLCPADGAKIDIERNEIRDSILNGINIVRPKDKKEYSSAAASSGNAVSACKNNAEIAVTGNRIYGSSSNRFLTINYYRSGGSRGDQGSWGYGKPYEGYLGTGLEDVVDECVNPVSRMKQSNTAQTAIDVQAILQAIEPMVWKSAVPDFPFPPEGVPANLLEQPLSIAGASFGNWVASGVRFARNTEISETDLIRFKADACFNLGRIRVVDLGGVSIKNNDLGYVVVEEGESPPSYRNSPQFGVVFEGSDAKFAESSDDSASFSGNNIDLYRSFAVMNTTGTDISAGMNNYMGGPEWEVSSRVTGTNSIVDSPVAGENRMVGPDPDVAMPDESAPELVTSGDNAPAVNGTGLTLTFDDMLDSGSTPAATAFRVMAGTSTILEVASVSISGMTVTLTLRAAAREGETVTVAYTKPASNAIMDDAGNALESFTATAVTNNSTGVEPSPPAQPGTQASSDDGGCALASTGSGVDLGALVLLLGAASFAFGLRRKVKAE